MVISKRLALQVGGFCAPADAGRISLDGGETFARKETVNGRLDSGLCGWLRRGLRRT